MLLVLISVLGLFAGCKPKQGNTNRYDENGKMNITIGIPESLLVEDYDTNAFTLWLEEKAGVNIIFNKLATNAGDYKTQLSVMMLDDNAQLPDILVNMDYLGSATWKRYAKEDYFLDLTPYFNDKEGKGKAYWDAVKESGISEAMVKDVLRDSSDDEGRIVSFPRIETTVIDTMDYMPMINQEWLDNLDLDMPKNPTDLYNVLKAFKTGDPNKNGFQDEYPMIGGAANGTVGSDIINWIVNMFVYYDDYDWFNLSDDGKKLVTAFTGNKYREAMIYLNKLKAEGLIEYNLSFNENSNLVNSKTPVVGIVVDHPTLVFSANKKTIDPYVAMPYWGYAVRREYRTTQDCFITEAALDGKDENPEVVDKCWELLCIMASKEGSYRQRYGEKGVNWDWADPGTKSFLGWDADIKFLTADVFGSTGNENWKDVAASLLPNAENESVQVDDKTDAWTLKKFKLLKAIYDAFSEAEKAKTPRYIMPHVVRTQEEYERDYNERLNCQNAVNAWRVKFINGEMDPNKDADWNAYLKELNDLGLQTWVNNAQKKYEKDYMAAVLDGTYERY